MDDRVTVWRRSTGERLPSPLPERLVKMNPDLTTEKPSTELVDGCCGEGLTETPQTVSEEKDQGEQEWQD